MTEGPTPLENRMRQKKQKKERKKEKKIIRRRYYLTKRFPLILSMYRQAFEAAMQYSVIL
jgi:hypothetical protein